MNSHPIRHVICLLPGVFCLLALREILALDGDGSSLRIVAEVVLGAGVLLSVFAAVYPDRTWKPVVEAAQRLLSTSPPSCVADRSSKITGVVLIAVAGVWLVMNWSDFERLNQSVSGGDDEAAYLQVAGEIADSGGTGALIGDLYGGEFSEANRNPLYLWLLSWRPEFTAGKRLSFAIAFVAFLVIVGQTLQTDGVLSAGCVAVLLATNGAFCRLAATVGCEPVLVLLLGLLWWQATWIKNCTSADATPMKPFLLAGHAAVTGLLLALLWLSKGTGLVVTAAFGAWIVLLLPYSVGSTSSTAPAAPDSITAAWANRARVARNLKLVCLLTLVWIAVASPLIVRNIRMYGEPFYNVNSWLMFVDTYSDPVALSQQQTVGETASEYLASHSVSDLVRREAMGLVWESFITIRMLGPAHLEEGRVLPGVLLSILIGIGFLLSGRNERWLIALLLLLSLPLFAWYVPVAAGERFPVPLLAPLLIMGTRGLVHVSSVVGRRLSIPPTVVTVGVLLIWLLARFQL